MILLDTNVFMYAAGAEHPHKEPSLRLLERVATGQVDVIIDAEVLQEILHRYRSIGRWAEGREVYRLARKIVPTVLPVTVEILDAARDLLDRHDHLIARDALHAAACRESGARAICSYDPDFDEIARLRRILPDEVE